MYVTYWLKPDVEYRAHQDGKVVKKTNLQFCEEVVAQIRKDKNYGADIIDNVRGEIAVKRFDRFPVTRKFVH